MVAKACPSRLMRRLTVVLGSAWLWLGGSSEALAQEGMVYRYQIVPIFAAVDSEHGQGFVRVVNHSNRGGEVFIDAWDDEGEHRGPVILRIGPREAKHFNSNDLEAGNVNKGLSGKVDDGEGDWHLEIGSTLNFEALAYMRSRDGFLTSLHDAVDAHVSPEGNEWIHEVVTFNPGSNRNQVSKLRLVNVSAKPVDVDLVCDDDRGDASGEVTTRLPANAVRTFTAQELEEGARGALRSLGDGIGKWRCRIRSDGRIKVMSLLAGPTGHLTNLSTRTAYRVAAKQRPQFLPLFVAAASTREAHQGFVRVTNHSDTAGTVTIEVFDDAGARAGQATLSIGALETRHFNAADLENGNPQKGLTGALGAAQGDWRLVMRSDLTLEALAYVRATDGFLTAMHDVVPQVGTDHVVPTFNPGSNRNQVSSLRLVNSGDASVEVSIRGVDDRGRSPGASVVVAIPPGTARMLTAQELEADDTSFRGAFLGDGTGKWRLFVQATGPITVMSLLSSPTGHLSNLSTRLARPPEPTFAIHVDDINPQPLQPLIITPAGPAGWLDGPATLRMDLSGTGAFRKEDTAEVAVLTTDQDHVLAAAPLNGYLPEANTSRSVALRMHRENTATTDAAISETANIVLARIDIPPDKAGVPTTALEMFIKAYLESSDDPILQAEALAVWPGVLTDATRALGNSTAIADEKAEAMLRQVWGLSALGASLSGQAIASALGASRFGGQFGVLSESCSSSLQRVFNDLGECIAGVGSFADASHDCGTANDIGTVVGGCVTGVTDKVAAVGTTLSRISTHVLRRPLNSLSSLADRLQAGADVSNQVLNANRIVSRTARGEDPVDAAVDVFGGGVSTSAVRKIFQGTSDFADALTDFGTSYGQRDEEDLDGVDGEYNAIKDLQNINLSAGEDGSHFHAIGGEFADHRETSDDEFNMCVADVEGVNSHIKLILGVDPGELFHCEADYAVEVDQLAFETSCYYPRFLNKLVRRTQIVPLHRQEVAAVPRICDARKDLEACCENSSHSLPCIRSGSDIILAHGCGEEHDRLSDAWSEFRTIGISLAAEYVAVQLSLLSGDLSEYSCDAGYRQFDAGANYSCVHESLVYQPEGNSCYGGSTRPKVDVGAQDVCMYYSRDFLQEGRTCRENYVKVSFQGRTTCRWAGLGAGEAVAYSIHKETGNRKTLIP